MPPHAVGQVLDVGCGSGAIAVSIAHECQAAQVVATDVSRDALAVAYGNADRQGVGDRIRFLCGDLLAPLAAGTRFRAILSNPPYIASSDIATLQPEVRDHEPRLALDGGVDGLDVIRRLVPRAATHLLPGGGLFIEVGAEQSSSVEALMLAAGFDPATVHTQDDLARIPRVVTGSTPA